MMQAAALLALLAASPPPSGGCSLDISLAHGNVAEARAQDQLQRIAATHDVSHWCFKKAVVIDSEAIPHSHPVLTLHTRHTRDDELLLSTFIHEQLHWSLASSNNVDDAIADLQKLFPNTPVGYPQGSSDERGNYVHLLVAYLEHRANQQLLGELRARQVMEFWAADHYTWIYRTVLDHAAKIGHVVDRHALRPRAGQRGP